MGNKQGSRLTHSHKIQYYYVKQSLTIWRDILDNMYKLWFLAQEDILDVNNPYILKDTGKVFKEYNKHLEH